MDTFYGGCSNGRFLEFSYSTGGTVQTVTTEQVTIVNSQFKNIFHDCDGSWAYINLRQMWMSISGSIAGVTFYNLAARYNGNSLSAGKGGVMYINTLTKLTMTNVVAEQFRVKQTTPTNGGGRFLYYNPNGLYGFELVISGSSFTCYTTAFTEST